MDTLLGDCPPDLTSFPNGVTAETFLPHHRWRPPDTSSNRLCLITYALRPLPTTAARPGRVSFMPKDCHLDMRHRRPKGASLVRVTIPDSIYQDMLPAWNATETEPVFDRHDAVAIYLLKAFAYLGTEKQDTEVVDHLTTSLIIRTAQWDTPGQIRRHSCARMRAVADYIEAHFDQPILISDMAAVANLSPYHFARLFKQAFGESPRQYILTRRVRRAKHMIRSEDRLGFSAIAADCGFASQSHMTTTFRQVIGCTPGEYRRSVRRLRP